MDSPQLLLSPVKVKGKADSSQEQANILDVAKKSLIGESTSVIVRHCSCYLSSWRYLTLIDIFGGHDGDRFTVASYLWRYVKLKHGVKLYSNLLSQSLIYLTTSSTRGVATLQ